MGARFIVYKWHRDNGTGVISISNNASPTKEIETGQRHMREQGLKDGITWQVHEGDFITAMVAASKLPDSTESKECNTCGYVLNRYCPNCFNNGN